MATKPTPEDCGRRILDIFGRFGTRGGEILMTGSIINDFYKDSSMRGEDLKAGFEWLNAQGYIEVVNQNTVRLTEAGFAAV